MSLHSIAFVGDGVDGRRWREIDDGIEAAFCELLR